MAERVSRVRLRSLARLRARASPRTLATLRAPARPRALAGRRALALAAAGQKHPPPRPPRQAERQATARPRGRGGGPHQLRAAEADQPVGARAIAGSRVTA